MKLIIDISKNNYNQIREGFYEDNCGVMAISIIYGTPIPDNATNGDVLKAIFPNTVFAEDKYEDDGTTWVDIISDDGMTFEMDFWNASYKVERKDNNE